MGWVGAGGRGYDRVADNAPLGTGKNCELGFT